MRLRLLKSLAYIYLVLSVNSVAAQFNNPRGLAFEWDTEIGKNIVPLNELTMVVPRGTFPAIDYPRFLSKDEGLKSFYKHEPAIVVEINGKAKAYPLNMLTMHEMSNDTLGSVPILPTYCPLCNASIVYDRRFIYDGQEFLLEFEVSGLLRNSDMVMADRESHTLWQQFTGQAIVGKFAGAYLNVIPSLVLSVEEFFDRYPDGGILSPNNGTRAATRYGKNPYEGYDQMDASPYVHFFEPEKIDNRLPPMERVVDIQVNGKSKIYPFSKIRKEVVVNDSFEDKHVVIFYKGDAVSVLDDALIKLSKKVGSATVFDRTVDGRVLNFQKKKGQFIDIETGSVWNITGLCLSGQLAGKKLVIEPHSNHFAFAWFAFHPESEVY